MSSRVTQHSGNQVPIPFPGGRSLYKISDWLFWGAIFVGAGFIALAKFNANLLPDWLVISMLIACGGIVAVDCLLGPIIRSRATAEYTRTPIIHNTLPQRHQNYFSEFESFVAMNGFILDGDFLTNPRLRTATREYLTRDRKTAVKLISGDAVSAINIVTLLADGRVIITSDIDIPYSHPMMDFNTGVRGDIDSTLEVHNAAVAAFDNLTFKIADDEMSDVMAYVLKIELQCIGKQPIQTIPIPDCRGRHQVAESNATSLELATH